MRIIPFALALIWGLNWPAVRVALDALPPFTLRAAGLACGTVLLLALAAALGRPLRLMPGMTARVVVAGVLNIAIFNIATAFAQLTTSTSRAAVLTFTMPAWTALLAWLLLAEKLDRRKAAALIAGLAGVALLAWPVVTSGQASLGLIYPLIAALSWAAGTVFLKWRPIHGDRIVATGWQLAVGAGCATLGMLATGEQPTLLRFDATIAGALVYHVVLSNALAYVLWFHMLEHTSAATSALTTLMIPIVGVLGAMALIGEQPGLLDLVGFAAVLGAAALILLPTRLAAAPASPQPDGEIR
ncbi:MAG: DMT family transporter [Burkholderiaceae bacterium]